MRPRRIKGRIHRAPLSRKASRISLLAGFIAAEVYSTYAIVMQHVLTAVRVFVFDPATGKHLRSGQIGAIGETFSSDGMIPLLVGTTLVFALTWGLVREGARQFAAPAFMLSSAKIVVRLETLKIKTNLEGEHRP
jgi:hypothetical protein